MKEAGVLIDREGHPLFWHMPTGRSGGALPDSRALWDVIWENRDRISGFAHTHPGYGRPGPSHTDITTFAAIEAGLGKRLEWWIASGDQLAVVLWKDEPSSGAQSGYICCQRAINPTINGQDAWLSELRIRSGFPFTPLNEPEDGDPKFHGTEAHGCMPCYGCNGFRLPNQPCVRLNCSTRTSSVY